MAEPAIVAIPIGGLGHFKDCGTALGQSPNILRPPAFSHFIGQDEFLLALPGNAPRWPIQIA
jgi:hypothetical protein